MQMLGVYFVADLSFKITEYFGLGLETVLSWVLGAGELVDFSCGPGVFLLV